MKNEQLVGGILCSEVLANLSNALDGDLLPETASRLTLHLAGCQNCQRFESEVTAALAAFEKYLKSSPYLDPQWEERLLDKLI